MKNNPMLQKSHSAKGPTTQTLNTKYSSPKYSREYLCKPEKNKRTDVDWEVIDGEIRCVSRNPQPKLPHALTPVVWRKFLDALLLREFIGDHVEFKLMERNVLFPDAMKGLASFYWLWSLPQLRHVPREVKHNQDASITAQVRLQRPSVHRGVYYKDAGDIWGTPFKIGRLNGPSLFPEVADGL